jgi:hypothetical protein
VRRPTSKRLEQPAEKAPPGGRALQRLRQFAIERGLDVEQPMSVKLAGLPNPASKTKTTKTTKTKPSKKAKQLKSPRPKAR